MYKLKMYKVLYSHAKKRYHVSVLHDITSMYRVQQFFVPINDWYFFVTWVVWRLVAMRYVFRSKAMYEVEDNIKTEYVKMIQKPN